MQYHIIRLLHTEQNVLRMIPGQRKIINRPYPLEQQSGRSSPRCMGTSLRKELEGTEVLLVRILSLNDPVHVEMKIVCHHA